MSCSTQSLLSLSIEVKFYSQNSSRRYSPTNGFFPSSLLIKRTLNCCHTNVPFKVFAFLWNKHLCVSFFIIQTDTHISVRSLTYTHARRTHDWAPNEFMNNCAGGKFHCLHCWKLSHFYSVIFGLLSLPLDSMETGKWWRFVCLEILNATCWTQMKNEEKNTRR